ncbi:hypothetical protein HY643_05285 [Candidatus Woesearchaeota archaeon]|nr:hypothetical protein [Candidatus Woesearchaeota archaeon]
METQKIVARILMEVMGSPKEHIEKTLKNLMEKMKTERDIKVLKYKVFEAEQLENKMWSTFAEVEVETNQLKRLWDLCFDYMPSSFEILEPEELRFNMKNLGDVLNDLMARLHKYDMIIKNLHAENILLKKEKEKS